MGTPEMSKFTVQYTLCEYRLGGNDEHGKLAFDYESEVKPNANLQCSLR
jgi:hypothetical protein